MMRNLTPQIDTRAIKMRNRPSKIRAQAPKMRTRTSKMFTQGVKMHTQPSKMRTQAPKMLTQAPKMCTRTSKMRTRDKMRYLLRNVCGQTDPRSPSLRCQVHFHARTSQPTDQKHVKEPSSPSLLQRLTKRAVGNTCLV
jgi:hypothetical protein